MSGSPSYRLPKELWREIFKLATSALPNGQRLYERETASDALQQWSKGMSLLEDNLEGVYDKLDSAPISPVDKEALMLSRELLQRFEGSVLLDGCIPYKFSGTGLYFSRWYLSLRVKRTLVVVCRDWYEMAQGFLWEEFAGGCVGLERFCTMAETLGARFTGYVRSFNIIHCDCADHCPVSTFIHSTDPMKHQWRRLEKLALWNICNHHPHIDWLEALERYPLLHTFLVDLDMMYDPFNIISYLRKLREDRERSSLITTLQLSCPWLEPPMLNDLLPMTFENLHTLIVVLKGAREPDPLLDFYASWSLPSLRMLFLDMGRAEFIPNLLDSVRTTLQYLFVHQAETTSRREGRVLLLELRWLHISLKGGLQLDWLDAPSLEEIHLQHYEFKPKDSIRFHRRQVEAKFIRGVAPFLARQKARIVVCAPEKILRWTEDVEGDNRFRNALVSLRKDHQVSIVDIDGLTLN